MEVKKKTVQRDVCLTFLRIFNRGREGVLSEGRDVVYACIDREVRK